MAKNFLKVLFFAGFLAITSICANAQIDASTPSGRPRNQEEMPKNIKESLLKHKIDKEKKDHEEMLKNGEEAKVLSEELEKSFSATNSLSSEDRKKIDRLEKILKKIRKELGGDDDDEKESAIDEDKPSTIVNALEKLQSAATNLLEELKKTSRFSISAVAIQSSYSLLKIVRFLRFAK